MCFDYLVSNHWDNICLRAVATNISDENVWWKTNNIYKYAVSHSIPMIDTSTRKRDELRKIILENDVNCIISNGYNWIIPNDILGLVNYQAFNLHLAPLPEYQGYFCYNHAILNGDKQYGVTLHWMTKEVDIGDYVFMPRFDIKDSDTCESLYNKSVELGYGAFQELLKCMETGIKIPRNKMVGTPCFYSKGSLDGIREIKNLDDTIEVDRKTRAFFFSNFEKAYFVLNDVKYHVLPRGVE